MSLGWCIITCVHDGSFTQIISWSWKFSRFRIFIAPPLQSLANADYNIKVKVAQSCPTLCIPDLPVHCQLPEHMQTHLHRIGDAIQPSHPLSFPSPTFNLSQHQGLFQWVSSSHQVNKVFSASVLPMNIQDWFPLGWSGWISLLSKGLSRVFSNTTVQKHQFFGAQLSL